jgi:lipid II:glycine glycyltransferase (peptidoglycan interpeptide bridge formation enzyme)
MTKIPQPYFIQTLEWAKFWKEAALPNHKYFEVSAEFVGSKVSAIVYLYPWHLKQNFLYVPKGFTVEAFSSQEELYGASDLLMQQIMEIGKKEGSSFVKLDFDWQFTDLLGIKDTKKLLKFVTKAAPRIYCKLSKKRLQYLSTAIIDTAGLYYLEDDSPEDFMNENKEFWAKTNENIRRYTKKSLYQGFYIDKSKTKENFEAFWKVYEGTCIRQNYATHPKQYFKTMLGHDFVRLIVLKDEFDEPQCVWFGVKIGDTLYYLYGGNTQDSFDKYGQYYMHLLALQQAAHENCMRYDLGGYDSAKGFGKFKEGYRGKIVNFLGPVDVVLKPASYSAVSSAIMVSKMFRR